MVGMREKNTCPKRSVYKVEGSWKNRKQIKEKAGKEERSQTLSVGIQKKKARLEVKIIAKQSDHYLVYIARSLIQCCAFPSGGGVFNQFLKN